jgi:hypothetical protein
MAIERVLFLLERSLTPYFITHFGFELHSRLGLEVEGWNMAPWVWRGRNGVTESRALRGERLFPDPGSTLAAVAALGPETFVVVVPELKASTLPVFRALSRSRAPYGLLRLNSLPQIASRHTARDRSWIANASRIADRGVRFATQLTLRSPRLLIVGAQARGWPAPARPSKTEILFTHAFDYDSYLKLGPAPEPTGPRYAVFLDEYLPFHPDLDFQQISRRVEPTGYYAGLRRFFDLAEQQLGGRVIIAVHPRADPGYEASGVFGDREMHRNRTAELIRDAVMVFAHSSTAIGLAVLYRKPVVFLTSPAIAETASMQYIEVMSRLLAQPVVNVGDGNTRPPHWKPDLTVSDPAYAAYQERYLKNPRSPDLPLWQIVADRLAAGV